jgi:hypothetical protein
MGKLLEALQKLQTIENQLAEVRRRLKSRSAAVESQQARIAALQADQEALHQTTLARQKQAASVELELKSRETEVTKYRTALNIAKSNKEYATILTHINTIKADNSKLEDEALKVMQAVDAVKLQAQEIKAKLEQAQANLEEIQRTSSAEIARLQGILDDLQAKRDQAAADVPRDQLGVFNRVGSTREGDAMAKIEFHGKKPPYEYVCGGCYMSLTAEHANALRTRDELRFCDNCGRILYLEEEKQQP